MHATVLLLLVSSGMVGVTLAAEVWVSSTEMPTKPSVHFWSTSNALPGELNTESTVSPSHVTVSEELNLSTPVPLECNSNTTCELLRMYKEKVDKIEHLVEHIWNATNPRVQTPCDMKLTAVSIVESNPGQLTGKIVVNGSEIITCKNKMPADNMEHGFGLVAVAIDPSTCKDFDIRYFKTYDANNKAPAEYFEAWVNAQKDGVLIAVTTCGNGLDGIGPALPVLMAHNVLLEEIKSREIATLAFITGHSNKGQWKKTSETELNEDYCLTGHYVDDCLLEKCK